MKAADCLREPGDAARRESDRAILVGWGGGMGCFAFPRSETVRWKLADIPGDDWQPLHPAGEGDWMARAYGAESVVKCEQQKNAELAAEVKRLTAELATATQTAGQELEWRVQAQLFGDKLQAEVNTLTARVAELESGSAFVGEEIKPGDFCADGELIYYLPKVDAPQDTLLAKECEGSAVVSDDGRIRYRCTFPTTAPLPTAGDEGKAEKIDIGSADTSMREHRAGSCLTTEEAVAAIDPAPAEPDSPAEEQPSKLRDESWVREAADAEDRHASVCAGDMTPRKPDCGRGWEVSDPVTKWMNEAPPEVRQLFSSIHVINFFHDERRRSFQVPRSNDGGISKGAEELFQECYETCDAIIKATESWRD